MVPITSQPSVDNPFAVEVPDVETRRARLDPPLAVWVVVDEANTDRPARSVHFEPGARVGAASSSPGRRRQR